MLVKGRTGVAENQMGNVKGKCTISPQHADTWDKEMIAIIEKVAV